jgi:CheY-like chemotaxis protein
MAEKLPYILMLEDDHDDRWLTSNALEELDLPLNIHFLSDSTTVLPALEKQQPLLILLDYNTQPETGLEVLRKIKAHAGYKHLPVVILGDTDNPHFVKSCYAEGANSYAIKPSTLEATKTKIQLFFQYWLQVAETYSPSLNTEPAS